MPEPESKPRTKSESINNLEEVDAKGTITAGTWVAEMDKGSIRKSSLRNT